jgi:hypothetical protein
MEMYDGMEVELHTVLTMALHACELSASSSSYFIPRKLGGTHSWSGDGEQKNSCPARN